MQFDSMTNFCTLLELAIRDSFPTMLPRPTLPSDQVHVFTATHADGSSPLIDRCHSLMSPEEHAREARYRMEHSRVQHALARGMVRSTLSRYAPVAAESWRFGHGVHERPEVTTPTLAPPLRFNIAHTTGMVVCAIGLERDVGADVEWLDRPLPVLPLSRRFFSPSEADRVAAAPPPERSSRFFEIWTLKESYLKARGLGLRLRLAAFSFHVSPDCAVTFQPPPDDDAGRWQFELTHPGRHVRALAIRTKPGESLRILHLPWP